MSRGRGANFDMGGKSDRKECIESINLEADADFLPLPLPETESSQFVLGILGIWGLPLPTISTA